MVQNIVLNIQAEVSPQGEAGALHHFLNKQEHGTDTKKTTYRPHVLKCKLHAFRLLVNYNACSLSR